MNIKAHSLKSALEPSLYAHKYGYWAGRIRGHSDQRNRSRLGPAAARTKVTRIDMSEGNPFDSWDGSEPEHTLRVAGEGFALDAVAHGDGHFPVQVCPEC